MERKARFCDITGEEIAENTGARLTLTKGEEVYVADVADSALQGLLDTLNNPEPRKKRGRKPGSTNEKKEEKEPVAA